MFKIIQAGQKDLQKVAFLFDQYRIFYKMPSDITAAKNFVSRRFTQQDSLIFIASKQTSAVGFMQVYPSFSSVAMQPIWLLNDLFIESSARRTGCARRMMEYLQEKAGQQAIFSIKLATAINNHKAKSLYESLGYQQNQDFDHFSKRIL